MGNSQKAEKNDTSPAQEQHVTPPSTNAETSNQQTESKTKPPSSGDKDVVPELAKLEEEKPGKKKIKIFIFFFILNSIDLGTDIGTGIEWLTWEPDAFELLICPDSTQSKKGSMSFMGVLILLGGIFGYGCYLFDAWREYNGMERIEKCGYNFVKLGKLLIEDSVSMLLITIVVNLTGDRLGTIGYISFIVSSISLYVMLFKEGVLMPCCRICKDKICCCITCGRKKGKYKSGDLHLAIIMAGWIFYAVILTVLFIGGSGSEDDDESLDCGSSMNATTEMPESIL